MTSESSYQKFTKDVFVIGITSILTALSGIILIPLLTKTLGASDYGMWAQVQVIVALIASLVGLGLPFAMTRFLPAMTDKKEIGREFWAIFCVVFIVAAAVSIIIIATADLIAAAFFNGEIGIVRITGLIIFIWTLDLVFLSYYRTFRQMIKHSLFTIANTYIQIGVIAYLVLNDYGIYSIILAILIIRLIIFFILLISIQSQLGIRRPNFSNTRTYLYFGLPTIPGTISAWVVASSDKYVISYFLGTISVGVYSAAYALGTIPIMLATVLGFVLPPALSKSYDEGRIGEVKTHLSYSLKYYLAVAIPFIFGSFVLAKPVLRLFSTPSIASEGYYIVPIVAIGILFYGTYIVITQILVVTKKTKIMGLIWIIAGVANLVLNIVFVPLLEILGASLTTLFAYFLAFCLGSYYSFKEFKFDIEWQFIIKSTVSSLVMSFAVWQMNPSSSFATIITVLVGIIVYGVAILILKGFTKEEFIFFKSLLKRRKPATDIDEKSS